METLANHIKHSLLKHYLTLTIDTAPDKIFFSLFISERRLQPQLYICIGTQFRETSAIYQIDINKNFIIRKNSL